MVVLYFHPSCYTSVLAPYFEGVFLFLYINTDLHIQWIVIRYGRCLLHAQIVPHLAQGSPFKLALNTATI